MGLPAPVGQPLAKPSVTLAFQIFTQACLFLRHLSSCLYSLAVFSQVTNPASTTFLHLLLTWPAATSQCQLALHFPIQTTQTHVWLADTYVPCAVNIYMALLEVPWYLLFPTATGLSCHRLFVLQHLPLLHI